MRYKNGVQCMMPYVHMNEDGTTDRCWAKFSFRGDVDRRRVKRELTKWVKVQLGRKLSAFERDMIIKRSHPIETPIVHIETSADQIGTETRPADAPRAPVDNLKRVDGKPTRHVT